MNTEDSLPMVKVRRLSGRLARLCRLALPVTLAAPFLWWLCLDPPLVLEGLPNGIPYPGHLTPAIRVGAAAVSLVPAAVLARLLALLARLFSGFAAGRVFCRESQDLLRRIGRTLALWFGAGVLTQTAMVLVLTLGNPPGSRILRLGFSGSDCAALFLMAVTWLLTSIFAEAARIADDNQGIV